MFLALDISTSIIGFSVFSGSTLVHWDFVDLQKQEDLFDKIDFFRKEIDSKISKFQISEFAVEEALKKFTAGASNANTITKLIAFNILVCDYLRLKFGFKPTYVNVNSARASCGFKFPKKSNPKLKKNMIADYVATKYQISFPTKKTGTLKDHAYDVSDSIVIAESVINARLKSNKS